MDLSHGLRFDLDDDQIHSVISHEQTWARQICKIPLAWICVCLRLMRFGCNLCCFVSLFPPFASLLRLSG